MSAWIAHKAKTHWLVQYRISANDPKRSWKCPPDKAVFRDFCEYVEGHARSQTPLPDVLPDKFLDVSPGPRKRQPSPDPQPTFVPALSIKPMTLAEWIGNPRTGKPGPFFDEGVSQEKGERHAADYESVVAVHAASIKAKPMAEVIYADARAILQRFLICPACLLRAQTAGNNDIINDPAALSVRLETPWDGPGKCVDTEGESTHHLVIQRTTVQARIAKLKAAFKAAVQESERGNPRLSGLSRSPFDILDVPQFDDRPDDDDIAQALSFSDLQAIEACMPAHLEAAVPVAAFGMLRRSELLGLTRQSIIWPSADATDQFAQIEITSVRVENARGGGSHTRSYGKTRRSTDTVIPLGELATEKLRKHCTTHLSNANPAVCKACRSGEPEWLGTHGTNPHHGCDFDPATPLWRTTDGHPLLPDAISSAFKKAAIAAGLTREKLGFSVTLKLLRATGATILLESGIAAETVQRMGRWSNLDTLKRHYNRIRDTEKFKAARTLNDLAKTELGLIDTDGGATPAEARVASLVRRNTDLVERIAALERVISELGGATDAVVEQAGRVTVERPRKWTDDDLRAAIESSKTRKEIVERLGVALTKKNYQRIEERAAKLRLTLPPRWGQPHPSEES